MSTQPATLLNWNAASRDYGEHRPGYPDDYFQLLQYLGIGLPGQQILDIGAGTGALAIPFARQGARVTAVDLSAGQIGEAREKAAGDGVAIRFIVSGAEDAPVETGLFHAVTASMCWGYFDRRRIIELIRRVLRPDGLLLISSIVWSGNHAITRRTNELVGRYNDRFTMRLDERDDPMARDWTDDGFILKSFHRYGALLPFTRESWRGRMRATKFIGAALPPERVAAFDLEHEALLQRIAPDRFEVPHDIHIQIFQQRESGPIR